MYCCVCKREGGRCGGREMCNWEGWEGVRCVMEGGV